MKIAVISANLGNFDSVKSHIKQSVPYDYFLFTDENFPPRNKTMTPRLQAKIPKCFAWQMVPGYDYYLWIDGALTLSDKDSLKHFLDNIQGYDLVALKHHKRSSIRQEVKFIRQKLKKQSNYHGARYNNELLEEQYRVVGDDKDYVDDFLLIGGVFLYRNTLKVQGALKEWWYHITRFHVLDQFSFAYVMKKAGLKIKILPDEYANCWYLNAGGHNFRAK